VNKIPFTDVMCYKSTFFSELNAMRARFPAYCEFYPYMYLLPDELPNIVYEHTSICGRTASAPMRVIKPRNGCCGRGIHFVQNIQDAETVKHPAVA